MNKKATRLAQHLIASLIILLSSLAPALHAAIQVQWSTPCAVPGEKVILYLIDEDCGEDKFNIRAPRLQNASVQLLKPRVGSDQSDPKGRTLEILPLIITPDRAGSINFGTIEAEYQSGRKETVHIPSLPVKATSEIVWFDSPFPYGVLWCIEKENIYINEGVKASLKIFLPQNTFCRFTPQFKSLGVKASNFIPTLQGLLDAIKKEILPKPQAYARSNQWNTQDFQGEFTPYLSGKNDITGKTVVAQQRGFFRVNEVEINLPTISISALPLPPGAPKDFDELVGQFKISSKTADKSLALNEMIEVEISVRASNNLQHISCPRPAESDNWKLLPATKRIINDANGNPESIIFHQLLRPIREVSGIPAFELQYFNPETQEYETASSQPIPMAWDTSKAQDGQAQIQMSAPPEAGSIPIAEMNDIYAYLPIEIKTGRSNSPLWVYSLIYLPSIAILLYMLLRKALKCQAAGQSARDKQRELKMISLIPDGLTYLRAIGAFIEKHIPAAGKKDAAIFSILQKRDTEAFRPDASSQVSESERKAMIKSIQNILKKAGKASLLFLLMLLPLSQAEQRNTSIQSSVATSPATLEEEARKLNSKGEFNLAKAKLQQAIQAVSSSDASSIGLARLYYHLGIADYRLEQEGRAAWNFARALKEDSGFKEARANLEFIQRKQGAIVNPLIGDESIFTYFRYPQQQRNLIILSGLLLLSICILVIIKDESKACAWLKASIVVFALLSILTAGNIIYYHALETPHISSIEQRDIAYVLQGSSLHLAADAESKPIIELPASTPLHVLASRPSWSYIECSNGVRGWIENKYIAALEQ